MVSKTCLNPILFRFIRVEIIFILVDTYLKRSQIMLMEYLVLLHLFTIKLKYFNTFLTGKNL